MNSVLKGFFSFDQVKKNQSELYPTPET